MIDPGRLLVGAMIVLFLLALLAALELLVPALVERTLELIP